MSGGPRDHPLRRMILMRLGIGLFTLLVISVLVFLAVSLLPGDIAQQILGQSATTETVAALRRELGLDQPLITRYFAWIGGILTGDFGRSLANGRPVADLLAARLGNTMFLAAYAAVIAVPLAVTLGLLAALWRGERRARQPLIRDDAVVLVGAAEVQVVGKMPTARRQIASHH